MDSNKKCKYCSRTFSTKSNMTYHQKTAKFCLKIQDKGAKNAFVCKGCSFEFAHMHKYNAHIAKCQQLKDRKIKSLKRVLKVRKKMYERKLEEQKIEYEQQIADLKEQLSENKGKIEALENGSGKTINNTTYNNPKLLTINTNNIRPLTYENVFEDVNEGMYTKEMFDRGIPGIVEFISNMITYENGSGEIERNYACTDTSRHRFHRFIETNEWKSDKGARFLTDILDCLEPEVDRYYNDLIGKRTKAHIIGDEEEYAHCNSMVQKMKPLYRGVKSKKGEAREKLFIGLRIQISEVASV